MFYDACMIQHDENVEIDSSLFSRKVKLRSEARLLIESFTNTAHIRENDTLYLRHPQNTNKKYIPKIIHQTYASQALSSRMRKLVDSWRLLNPGWEIRFYDDEACLDFVTQQFPEYLDAYVNLPKSVERSDFFRYLIIYKYGGVYTDIDTECRQPLDEVLNPTDTMVVGWEKESVSEKEALINHFVRANQVLQWTFMAAPGHPALKEVCDFIRDHATAKLSDNTNRDTLEKTGPGIFTDIVLRHSKSHPPFSVNDEQSWPIRFLPRVALGAHPKNKDGVMANSPEVKVLHHFMGGWKSHFVCWSKCKSRKWGKKHIGDFNHELYGSSETKKLLYTEFNERKFFPVSSNFKPTFEISVHKMGAEVNPGGEDISNLLSKYGRYQAGLHPTENPSVVDALVGSLGGKKRSVKLLDIGAGIGFFSLAAAARGHDVEAFETSAMSLEAFEDSRKRNGFEDFIKIHKIALGEASFTKEYRVSGETSPEVLHTVRHGYPSMPREDVGLNAIGANVRRLTTEYRKLEDGISLNKTVGAVRISANGWESAIIDGGRGLFGHPSNYPSIVLIEMNYAASIRAGQPDPARVLSKLYDLGYTKISHAGPICKRRYKAQTRSVFFGSRSSKQATWCSLLPEEFPDFVKDERNLQLESVVFYKERDWSKDLQLLHPVKGDNDQQSE